MSNNGVSEEKEIEMIISALTKTEERNPRMAADGRARFLAQAHSMAQAVSKEKDLRQTGRSSKFFERLWNVMKPQLKYSALTGVAMLLVVVIVMVNNVTTVSAQQILDRASAAQSAVSGQGIWHTRYEVYENPGAVTGKEVGETTFFDNTYHLTASKYRMVTEDAQGNIRNLYSTDGDYYYSTNGPASGSPVMVYRTPNTHDPLVEKPKVDLDATTTAMYDQFNNNPLVKVEGKVDQPNGRQAYVLVKQNEQVQKIADGQDKKTSTGTTKMIFDAKTYSLLEIRITLLKNGKDIILFDLKSRIDEVLPVDSKIAWDFSDLKGIKIADESEPVQTEEPVFETLTPKELAGRTVEAYVLKTVPAGFTQKIVVGSNQPESEFGGHDQFEVNYEGKDNALFGLQFMGKLDEGFAETNFYDGSYKTASGLVLHYSTGGSCLMVSPAGNGYLVRFTMPRDEMQKLAEDLIPLK
ncbi:MAG TPA: hypothetical protein VF338_03295 [Leptolinea sp.]